MSADRRTNDHGNLVTRLGLLGDVIAVDDQGVIDAVLDRIRDEAPPSRRTRTAWLVAAVLLALLVGGVLLQPDARSAVAGWFDLTGVEIRVDPDSDPPATSLTRTAPGPGETRQVVVDGRRIVVSAVSGELLVAKTVGSSDQISAVTVDGFPGLWIAGTEHEVLYEDITDGVVVERVARNTLLWTVDDVLYRVEGFDELGDALAYAEGT